MKINSTIIKLKNNDALEIALTYVVASSLWILFSDKLLLLYPQNVVLISTLKGWLYTIVVGLFIFFEIKRRINKMLLTEEKLKEFDKLKDDFLMITTHEMKTPLVPIKSQCQLLLTDAYGKLNLDQKNSVEMIYRNEEALNLLASDIHDITKINSNKMKITRSFATLEEIITNSISDLKSLAENNQISLSVTIQQKIPKMYIDAFRIQQVIKNLIDNAIKFTESGGVVKVDVQKIGDSVLVSISDTGIGIIAENIPKLFIPFYQIQEDPILKHKGTGLGLAISKGLIEAHGGTIMVESPGEGKGSTFTVTLPLLANTKA